MAPRIEDNTLRVQQHPAILQIFSLDCIEALRKSQLPCRPWST